jgi:hypothetical protein
MHKSRRTRPGRPAPLRGLVPPARGGASPVWWSAAAGVILAGCQPFQGQIFGWEPESPPPAHAGGGASGRNAAADGEAGSAGDAMLPIAGDAFAGRAGENAVEPPKVDPNSFDWARTEPGGGGGCVGGLYQGAFSCAPEGLNVIPIEGSMTVELIGPTEGQTLDVSFGSLQSVPAGGTGFEAVVTGKVACAGYTFMGKVEEVPVTVEQLGVVVQILWNVGTPSTTLSGYLVGRLTPQSLEGEIQLIMVTNTCKGQFALRVQP